MKYLSVADIALRWKVAERTVRNYCANGKILGARLIGKTWSIPETATQPERVNKRKKDSETLLSRLRTEKAARLSGGIYHKVQVEFTYNSNRIEGSKLSHEQTRYIFETNTIGLSDGTANVDDIIETANHFRCIDYIIEQANTALSEKFMKKLHHLLKSSTSDARKDWFAVGAYKRLPNEVGGKETAAPEDVAKKIHALLARYNALTTHALDDILDFHVQFERIHPFQDGNGRVGRLILFKECLKNNITPFIIDDEFKLFYYRGLQQWSEEQGYLRDTCKTAQEQFARYLAYFRIGTL